MLRIALILSPVLLSLTGCGVPSFLITPVQNTSSLKESVVKEGMGWSPPKIAIIEVEGMLMNMRTGGFMQPSENAVSRFTQEMERAAADPDVKAVVLRVNSPGGTVAASDIMYQTVTKFREKTKKPVVASLQDVAASGAYYVACGSDRIVAHPMSVVGSIGVIFNTMNFQGTLEKIGAKVEAIKSGPLKDMGSPFRELDPQARTVMQGMVDEYYQRFVSIVTTHRTLNGTDAKTAATDGRVFSGVKAVEVGLADKVGLLDDAIEEAKNLSGARNARVILYKRPYGYTGSIYADGTTRQPEANVMQLKIPGLNEPLPVGFYYLWNP